MLFASCGMERVFTLIWWVSLARTRACATLSMARPLVSDLLQAGSCGVVATLKRRTCVPGGSMGKVFSRVGATHRVSWPVLLSLQTLEGLSRSPLLCDGGFTGSQNLLQARFFAFDCRGLSRDSSVLILHPDLSERSI